MDLRLRGPKGQSTLRGVDASVELRGFLDEVAGSTGVSRACLQLLAGFPPKPLELPEDLCSPLSSLGLRSGETLIAREVEPAGATGVVVRRVVDSNNSCLFEATGYVIHGSRGRAQELRGLAAELIAADGERYSEAFLGKPSKEYVAWLQKADSWGGAIEVSVFSERFRCEIAAFDICHNRRDLYGEGMGYPQRALLIYDGIHYDALALAAQDGTPEDQDLVRFNVGPAADHAETKAAAYVAEQHQQRKFVDTGTFTLRCLVCQQGVVGESQALEHAKATGHQNFGQY